MTYTYVSFKVANKCQIGEQFSFLCETITYFMSKQAKRILNEITYMKELVSKVPKLETGAKNKQAHNFATTKKFTILIQSS